MRKFGLFLSVGCAAFVLGLAAWSADARYGSSGKVVSGPLIRARLVDEIKNAAQGAATVEVTAQGIRLVDPALASHAPGAFEGHLHYQVDGGPVIDTPAPKLSFHELPPGEHKISVNLADDNHMPIGMPVVLTVRIPAIKTVMAY